MKILLELNYAVKGITPPTPQNNNKKGLSTILVLCKTGIMLHYNYITLVNKQNK